jgi:hypothetical protein
MGLGVAVPLPPAPIVLSTPTPVYFAAAAPATPTLAATSPSLPGTASGSFVAPLPGLPAGNGLAAVHAVQSSAPFDIQISEACVGCILKAVPKLCAAYPIVCGGVASFNMAWTSRLPGAIHRHHVFPTQFRERFANIGIAVDDYAVPMTVRAHELLHKSWNRQWKEFLDRPGVQAADAYVFAAKKWRDAGLGDLPIGPYTR